MSVARALDAAREAAPASMRCVYRGGNHVIDSFRFGLALHVGQVLYGNIGGGNRLDFTCIGPAVNLAARLEKIAGRLNRTVVASADFAAICDFGAGTTSANSRSRDWNAWNRFLGWLDETAVDA